MKRGVILRRIAEREFSEAIAWYEAQWEGLGKEFRGIIHQRIQDIAANPELFPVVRGGVRRVVVIRRFGYVIHFKMEGPRIIILAIFHTSRQPDQLQFRP